MNRIPVNGLVLAAVAGAVGLGAAVLARAQGTSVAPRYEVAMIKWDGPDKVQFLTPQKSEAVRLFKMGVVLPPEIRDEEFCLTWAANKLAQEGWEPVNLNSTRILLRRPVTR